MLGRDDSQPSLGYKSVEFPLHVGGEQQADRPSEGDGLPNSVSLTPCLERVGEGGPDRRQPPPTGVGDNGGQYEASAGPDDPAEIEECGLELVGLHIHNAPVGKHNVEIAVPKRQFRIIWPLKEVDIVASMLSSCDLEHRSGGINSHVLYSPMKHRGEPTAPAPYV